MVLQLGTIFNTFVVQSYIQFWTVGSQTVGVIVKRFSNFSFEFNSSSHCSQNKKNSSSHDLPSQHENKGHGVIFFFIFYLPWNKTFLQILTFVLTWLYRYSNFFGGGFWILNFLFNDEIFYQMSWVNWNLLFELQFNLFKN